MKDMYRYFLHTDVVPHSSYDRFRQYIERFSPNEYVTIDENVDMPSISIDLDLLKNKGYERPKNNEFHKYREIEKEDFYNYLAVTMDAFKTFKSKDAEIYFDNPFSSKYEIVFFSTNSKNKFRFDIEVNFDLEWGEVRVTCSRSFSRRPYYRGKALPISAELFEYIKLKAYEYLADDLNYLQNFKPFLKIIDLSYKGKIKPILPDKTIDINPLITELSNQIRQIETRLLNSDSDKRETREKLRGRIEGLKSAIFEISNFFSDVN